MKNSTDWLTVLKPQREARLRLFCFPYAGGGSSIFRQWPKFLPETMELCAVQLPGREVRLREPPLTELARLVKQLANALMPFLDRPYAFFGHSMGALVAFELARRLRDQPPIHLFLRQRLIEEEMIPRKHAQAEARTRLLTPGI